MIVRRAVVALRDGSDVGIGLGYLATLSGDAKLDRVVIWSGAVNRW